MRRSTRPAHPSAAPPRTALKRPATILAVAATSISFMGLAPATSAVASAGQPLTAALAAQLAQNVSKPVVVLMKNQAAAEPAGSTAAATRASAIAGQQAPLMTELSQVHATQVKSYRLINAFAATVSAGEEARLAANPAVAQVIPDSVIRGPSVTAPSGGTGTAGKAISSSEQALACPASNSPAKPLLEPEALPLIHAASDNPGAKTAQSLGITGKGVKVAYIADGIDPANPDLANAFVDYKDFTGDGPSAPTPAGEAFLDATSIAAQGRQVYNVQNFGAHPLPAPCYIRILGVAPGAQLVGLKVFASNNATTTSNFLQAIDYAVRTGVNVINESFGANPFPDTTSQDAVAQFNDAAVAAGVTVTVSSGDAGTTSTIGSPSTDPRVISAGGSTDFRWLALTDYGAADQFATHGWLNNNITSLSSGGFTQTGRTVDLVSPGDSSFAVCTPSPALYPDCADFNGKPSAVERSGGTSQSSPLTAGAAALVIQAFRQAHKGATPSPALVKQILTSTADDLGTPAYEQGSGLLDAYRAVRLAQSIGAPAKASSALLVSQGQLNATAAPGTPQALHFSVTNYGSATKTIKLSGRSFGSAQNKQTGSVTLSDTASPTFADWSGVTSNYGVLHFKVKPGTDRLDASIAYPGNPANGLNARVRLILIDPLGRYAAHSLPQGVGNFGHVDVRFPAAGTWTGVIFSRQTTVGGTVGKILFEATTSQFAGFGSVSPAVLKLAPGHTGQVTLRVQTPAQPGDVSGSVVLNAGSDGTSSVAVVLRSLVNVAHGGAFSGTLTGGNGRQSNTGQTNYYEFNVPQGQHNLSADVLLTNDQTDSVLAYLINPAGQTVGYGANYLATGVTAAGITTTPTTRTSLYSLNPAPGRWTLAIDFNGAIVGDELSQPYHGSIRFNTVAVHATGLPDSPSTSLHAGTAVSVPVTIKNTGAAPEDFFVDGRLNAKAAVTLAPLVPVTALALPLSPGTPTPQWVVPTQTDGVQVTANASLPVNFDFGIFPGDPDVVSSTGTTAVGSFNSSPVTAGLWFANPSELGPYTDSGGAPGTVSLAMTAHTRQFDPAVTSDVGDFWQGSVNPAAPFGLLVVNSGQTATIHVTITPAGPKGTVVHGTLYVDDFVTSSSFLSGDELVGLPYTYTIG